jgi:hypothetical protein
MVAGAARASSSLVWYAPACEFATLSPSFGCELRGSSNQKREPFSAFFAKGSDI